MRRYAIVPVLALLIPATAGAAVDPALLNLVMPDAKVIFGVQVQQALASPFGKYAVTRLLGNSAMTHLAAATGFDVQRDLQELVAASASPSSPGDRTDALVLARGTFAADKFIALATVAGATVYDYRGVTVIMPQERGARVFAFLDSSTLAVGSEQILRDAIDRRANQTVFSGPLLEKTRYASASSDAWFATVAPLTDLIPTKSSGALDPTVFLQSVIESWAALRFNTGGVTVYAEALTHSDAEAQGLAGILKLAAGMVKGTPAAALQNAQVTSSGAVTRVTVTVGEQDLERTFQSASPRRAAR